MTIQEVAKQYETAALTACKEAERNGEDTPRLVSIHLLGNAYVADFLAPVHSFQEVREEIIKNGGAYHAVFI